MQAIDRDFYSYSSVQSEAQQPGPAWYERVARLLARPERKSKIDPDNAQVDIMNDHMQTLMVTDLFLHR